jgi:hypothetical protein
MNTRKYGRWSKARLLLLAPPALLLLPLAAALLQSTRRARSTVARTRLSMLTRLAADCGSAAAYLTKITSRLENASITVYTSCVCGVPGKRLPLDAAPAPVAPLPSPPPPSAEAPPVALAPPLPPPPAAVASSELPAEAPPAVGGPWTAGAWCAVFRQASTHSSVAKRKNTSVVSSDARTCCWWSSAMNCTHFASAPPDSFQTRIQRSSKKVTCSRAESRLAARLLARAPPPPLLAASLLPGTRGGKLARLGAP